MADCILYPETEEDKQKLLAEYRAKAKLKRIEKMHAAYGSHFPDHCGECKHFTSTAGYTAKTYFKCMLSGPTHGPATDWRRFWDACGKFERKQL